MPTTYPSGTILATKVDGNDNFAEEILTLQDFIGHLLTASGSLVYSNGADNLITLAPGSNGSFLTVSGGALSWGAITSANNLDGGTPSSVYSGTNSIDGGGA